MSKSSIEVTINELLKEQELSLVADTLLKKWNQNELSYEDKKSVSNFLVHCQLYSTLKNQILYDLSQNKEIIWTAISELFHKTKNTPSDEFVNSIILGLLETDRLNEILEFGEFASKHNRLKTTYEKLLGESLQKIGVNYTQLKSLLTKKEYDKLFEDKELATDYKKQLESYIKNAKKNPEYAYDLAISLAQSEQYEAALECLKYSPQSMKTDWLKLDLLVNSKKYILAIEESFKIELKYSEHADTLVDVLIIRAKSYFSLGEKNKATSILKTILNTIPKNQKSKILLNEWENLDD